MVLNWFGQEQYHEKAVAALLETHATKGSTVEHIADLFKGFADPTRVHILYLLAQGERCVGDIAEGVQISQSAISHQLRMLKQMHLIKYRREGKNVLYSLDDDHVKIILETGLEHVTHE